MKIGIIGTGNMGRILAEAILDGKAVSPSSLIITNRTLSKALEIKAINEEIIVKKRSGGCKTIRCSFYMCETS